jgi:hypothetical protein
MDSSAETTERRGPRQKSRAMRTGARAIGKDLQEKRKNANRRLRRFSQIEEKG